MKNKQPSVTLKLEGGLGNQLYEYAVGFLLAARLNVDLRIDQYVIPLSTVHGESLSSLPEFDLPALPHSKETIFLPRVPRNVTTTASRRFPLIKKIAISSRLKVINYSGPEIYAESTIEDLLMLSTPRRIHGNFQSWEYVEEAVKYGFPRELKLKSTPSWLKAITNEIVTENAVAVHFRMGSDARGNATYAQPSVNYYESALSILSSPPKNIYVFSDDIAAVKRDFGKILGDQCNFVEPPLDATPPEKMFLLSSFSNLICANSTFCTWAGWSIVNRNGKVCVPHPYSDSEANLGSRDFSDKWITLDKFSGKELCAT